MDTKFQDLNVIQLLEETHAGTTKVYLVKQKNQLAVCKSISNQYLQDPKKKQHLQNQIQALTFYATSPHVNHLLCNFSDEDNHYLVIRAAMGLPLHKLMQMGGVFPARMVSLIVPQVCWIIQTLHRDSFVYRDVKASNFMIDSNGKIVLIDLGLSKRIGKKRTNTICGTAHAMPPQIVQKKMADGYSFEVDYYSIGILIYELIVGTPPFGYKHSNEKLNEDILQGLTQNHLNEVSKYDKKAADLISRLVCKVEKRLGNTGGMDQILQHEYFKSLKLDEIKKIYEGGKIEEEAVNRYDFVEHKSEIQDFGIEEGRYDEIEADDPFFKFG